jgi:hypothetical protein
MYQIKFFANRIGFVTVKFTVAFGDLKVFYRLLNLVWKPDNGVSFCEGFEYEAQKIRLVSIEIHEDTNNIGWDRLDVSEMRLKILRQILEIKARHEGNYIQRSEYNWIP